MQIAHYFFTLSLLFIGTAGAENKARSPGIKKRTGFSAGPQKRGDIFLSVGDGAQPSTTSPVRTWEAETVSSPFLQSTTRVSPDSTSPAMIFRLMRVSTLCCR